MEEKVENNNENVIKTIIGVLLMIPIYMIFFILLHLLNFNNDSFNIVVLPLLMYIPIIVGMFLTYKYYKERVNIGIGICLLIFLCVSIYFYINTYFINQPGWDALGYFIYWLASMVVCRILLFIFYGNSIGWKRALVLLGIYVLFVFLSLLTGFWE